MEYLCNSLLDEAVATGLNVALIGEAGAGKQRTARLLHARKRTIEFRNYDFHIGDTEHWSLIERFINELSPRLTGSAPSTKTYFLRNIQVLDRKQILNLLDYFYTQLDNGGSSSFAILHAGLICSCEPHVTERSPYRELITQFFPIEINMPPLRERRDKITTLVSEFLSEYAGSNETVLAGIEDDARALLENYCWPGNISELKSVLGHACTLVRRGETISRDIIEKRLGIASAFLLNKM